MFLTLNQYEMFGKYAYMPEEMFCNTHNFTTPHLLSLMSPPTKFDRPKSWKHCQHKVRTFTSGVASGDEILELILMFMFTLQ